MGVRVEIFAIGNELCYGRVYDTNSFWIAEQTTRLGAKVQRITCVPDVVEEICTALSAALDRNPDFIILTGGLGPTSDDLTIESLSKILGVEIEINNRIFRALAERGDVTKDDLPVIAKMSHSLKDASCFPNPDGWAPVTLVEKGETTLVALPGPPEEMKVCFTAYLAKRIGEKTQYRSVSRRILVKMYEDQASLITKEIMKKIPGTYLKPLVGNYNHEMGLPVDILVFAEDEKTCKLRMKKALKKLRELVGKKHAQ
ncbi:MAG: competence/damage-inducible protein A [Candidatus Bathyarchaeia archaeon]